MVRHDWESVPLTEITKCQGGAAFSPSLQGRNDGDVAFFKVSDMNLPGNQWFMRRANNYVSNADKQRINGDEKPSGAVIFPKVGAAIHTNKKRILAAPAFVDNNVMAVWSTDSSRCTPSYLYLYFLSKNLSEFANPGPLPSINNGKIYEQTILLPPVREQNKIAAVLWKVRRAIEIEERLVAIARELKESAMCELFTCGLREEPQKDTEIGPIPKSWRAATIADVTSLVYRYPTYYNISYTPDGVPEVRGELLLENGVIDDSPERLRFIGLETASKFPQVRLVTGDIVMSVRGTMGKLGIVRASLEGAVITANLVRLATNHDVIDPEYLRWVLLSRAFQERLDKVSPKTTIKTITAPELKRLLLPLPEAPEQHQIAEMLEAMERKINIHERKRATLEELFKTLLHQLMTGEIRVADLDIDVSEVLPH